MKNNQEKWILGTGFSRGIGAQVAKEIHKKDYKILHIGRTKGQYDDIFLECDLSKALSSEFHIKLYALLLDKNFYGFLYGAGFIPELICHDSVEEKVKFWISQRIAMNINYFSCAELVEELIPFLIKSRNEDQGVSVHEQETIPFVAHISSLASVDPLPNLELYGITKSATLRYFEFLSQQYSVSQLECLSIHPGTVQTDMFDQLLKTEYKNLAIAHALEEAQKSHDVISSEQSAKLIVSFLFDPAFQEIRKSAHGKLYIADSNQIW